MILVKLAMSLYAPSVVSAAPTFVSAAPSYIAPATSYVYPSYSTAATPYYSGYFSLPYYRNHPWKRHSYSYGSTPYYYNQPTTYPVSEDLTHVHVISNNSNRCILMVVQHPWCTPLWIRTPAGLFTTNTHQEAIQQSSLMTLMTITTVDIATTDISSFQRGINHITKGTPICDGDWTMLFVSLYL